MFGSGATGRNKYATVPATNRPMDSRMVATGRAMKGAEKFTC